MDLIYLFLHAKSWVIHKEKQLYHEDEQYNTHAMQSDNIIFIHDPFIYSYIYDIRYVILLSGT